MIIVYLVNVSRMVSIAITGTVVVSSMVVIEVVINYWSIKAVYVAEVVYMDHQVIVVRSFLVAICNINYPVCR